jgi:hypothetical protein
LELLPNSKQPLDSGCGLLFCVTLLSQDFDLVLPDGKKAFPSFSKLGKKVRCRH